MPAGSGLKGEMTERWSGNRGKDSRAKGRKRTERFSRSTIACDGCRVRKQKCGGEKPICLRCRTVKQPCTWPEQFKRGPSRGYNESLEQRLRETESVLIAVLDAVSSSDSQFNYLNNLHVTDSSVTPSAAEKKERLEEWANLPLRTRDDVMHWRAERIERVGRFEYDQGLDRSIDQDPEDSIQQIFDEDIEVGTLGISNVGRRVGCAVLGSIDPLLPGDDIPVAASETYDQSAEHGHSLANRIPGAGFETYVPPLQDHRAVTTRSPSVAPGNGLFRLSKEFKDNFLW